MKIIGVMIKYYKCYEATIIVPLFFDQKNFVGFIGENGVGKSAVLEALNSFFTNQHWTRNKTGKKGQSSCTVAPIISFDENELPSSDFVDIDIDKIKEHSKTLVQYISDKIDIKESENVLYASCAFSQDGSIKIFDGTILDEDSLAGKLRKLIYDSFRYVYVKAEVDIDSTTDINSETLEFIKGSNVVNEIADVLESLKINEKGVEKKLSDIINNKLEEYLKEKVVKKLQEVDSAYDYKNLKTGAISKISEKHISELATQALFNNRELCKKIKNKNIGISDMSSGQRRRALLDFILVMIDNLDETKKKKVILAIDEPELSVDASTRIQQFDNLYKTSKKGSCVLFTTHWYGWLTQLLDGNTNLFKENENGKEITSSNIEKFLEKDTQSKVPYEMRMMFDFLSSLGSWAEADPSKKFIICEGISDYNFILKHFPEHKIIPSRGIDEVVRLYKIFTDYYFRVDRKPKNVIFLIDTDPEKAANLKDVQGDNLRRISRDNSGKVKILNNLDNYSEKCAIEDILHPRPFLEALKKSIDGLIVNETDRDFINSLAIVYEDEMGIRAFSLDDVKKTKFKNIYNGEYKKKVSELYSPSDEEIKIFKNFFNSI